MVIDGGGLFRFIGKDAASTTVQANGFRYGWDSHVKQQA
jgi:hypothetical protein